ncbi:hypothetical protein NUSPORA_00878 [Nucleospora cyclopteri]
MFEGQCVFSGLMVPRGSGLHKVCNDGKVLFTRGRKERNFIEAKVSARSVKWTESSRAFFKKTNKSTQKEEQIYTITKKIRGFNLIPRNIMEKEAKKTQKQAINIPTEKIHKNVNARK